MCLNIGTPKNINFPFEINGKLMILGVLMFKHFRVITLINGFRNKEISQVKDKT